MDAYLVLLLAAAAVAATWLPDAWRYKAAGVLVALLLGLGWKTGAVALSAFPGLAAMYAAAWWAGRRRSGRVLAWCVFIGLALGIGFGLLPGLSPLVLSEAVALKPDSVPFGLRLGLGKPLVAVAMLLWLVPVARGTAQWRALLVAAAPVIAVTAVLVPTLAWAIDYVHPAPVLPALAVTLPWVVMNLLLVCPAEEAFFRGLMQRGLARIVPASLALIVAALAFGAAHFAGGWQYVALASVAGAGYGLAYRRAGQRVEAAILTHFAVNLTHFALFTYPSG